MHFRMKLDARQAQLRDLDPTVLIENEEDLVDFPPPNTYTFTKDPIYKAYEPSNNGDILVIVIKEHTAPPPPPLAPAFLKLKS